MRLNQAAQNRADADAKIDQLLDKANAALIESAKKKPETPKVNTESVSTLALDLELAAYANHYNTTIEILDQLYNQKRCPRCNSILGPTTSISGAPSTDWLECTNAACNTFVDTYHPMPHQTSVHEDPHRVIGNFGSYGTGKTKTSEKEIEKHIFITPNANILLGANITSQYEQTLLEILKKVYLKHSWMDVHNKRDTSTLLMWRDLCFVHSTILTSCVPTTTVS
jgi:hypothetical protein